MTVNGIKMAQQSTSLANDSSISKIERIESKPIFMIGLPNSHPPEYIEEVAQRLKKQLSDYHVLVILNTTDTYSAKLFSEKGEDTLDINQIERYIDQKLRK
jgi:hypothetical protein